MLERTPDELLRLFRSFATMSVFICHRNPAPMALASIAKAVKQSTGLVLSEEDVAVFRGLLATHTIDLFWSTDHAAEVSVDKSSAKRKGDVSFYLPNTRSPKGTTNVGEGNKNCWELYFRLNLDSLSQQESAETRQKAAKRRRGDKAGATVKSAAKKPALSGKTAPNLVEVVSQLVAAFTAKMAEARQQEDGWLQKLVKENLPDHPSARHQAGNRQGLSDSDTTNIQSVNVFLERLRTADFYSEQLLSEAAVVTPAAPAQYQELQSTLLPPAQVSGNVWNSVAKTRNICQLYTHQAQAISGVLRGNNLVVSTSTASGKSIIYQLPILQMLCKHPESTFLVLFPTKALAQDQLQAMQALVQGVSGLEHVLVSTFDGDTSTKPGAREQIRRHASVVLTNPDTLHMAVLPNRKGWQSFLDRLRLVVIDEMHVYQGQFGQHCSHIFARLQRLCSRRLQFVACSATASNDPASHMKRLTHVRDVTVVDSDGSPHGKRHLLVWKQTTANAQRHPYSDISLIAGELLSTGLRTIVFCKYRQLCELVFREITDYLDSNPLLRGHKPRVLCYRGGYTAGERRMIESSMFSGQACMVVATSALELGIDIGNLDAVLMVGMPFGGASSMWQQIGRAGRQPFRDSIAMIIATGNPVDQAALKHPEHIFAKPSTSIFVSAETSIRQAHLHCAAFEQPISFGDPSDRVFLENMGVDVTKDASSTIGAADGGEPLQWDPVLDRWICSLGYKPWPAQRVMVRSMNKAADNWQVIQTATSRHGLILIEELDPMHALFTLYEGGIFLHQGHTYSIDRVDPEMRVALVSKTNVSWYTEQRDYRDVIPSSTLSAVDVNTSSDVQYLYGKVDVVSTVFGYKRIDTRTKKVLEMVEHMSPKIAIPAIGAWIDLPLPIVTAVSKAGYNVEASIHGAQHALLAALSKTVGCMRAPVEVDENCIGHPDFGHGKNSQLPVSDR
ncbi:ATP-dependent 3'-5' DNA helicase [Coemansia sp. Benny D115]|nr:ATP-dependent 3'-5' DNA helicase [Coemansia sp. Benny D115]